VPSAASKQQLTSSAQVVRVRKPGPGIVILKFPFDLTTREGDIHVATYLFTTHKPEPELDHLITGPLISELTTGTNVGVIVDKFMLFTYRCVGPMPKPHRTPRIVSDRHILAATHKVVLAMADTQLRFVSNTSGRVLRHGKDAPLTVPMAR